MPDKNRKPPSPSLRSQIHFLASSLAKGPKSKFLAVSNTMKLSPLLCAAAGLTLFGSSVQAQISVVTGHRGIGADFVFKNVPQPANNDAATAARFTVVDGEGDRNGAGVDVLHDGLVPSGADEPSKNFFFQAGSDGGRIQVDLGRAISVKQVGSYSWHGGARGPQVYSLYAADGLAAGFKAEPKRGVDPSACGWKLIAKVDTRVKDDGGGGQHGVAITSDSGAIGTFRYLLFDMSKTENRDRFGNTFYSEIDVIDAKGSAPVSGIVSGKRAQTAFEAGNGKYAFIIDSTDAPDLAEWAEKELKPVAQAWYPKLVTFLSSEGYNAPAEIMLRFQNDMGGTPASAGGGRINLNAGWFRQELKREALGAVVHEMVHVVQNYGRANRKNPKPAPTPGWVVEGIADYVRWFLYEPQSRGAEITKGNLAGAKYDGSYRITGNFLNWVIQKYDKDLLHKLNAAAREGRYDEALWKAWTGKSLQDLGDEWKKFHEQRLSGGSQ